MIECPSFGNFRSRYLPLNQGNVNLTLSRVLGQDCDPYAVFNYIKAIGFPKDI